MFKTNESTMRTSKDDRKTVNGKPNVPMNKATVGKPKFSMMNDVMPEKTMSKHYTKMTSYKREV